MPPRAVALQGMLEPDAPAFADDYFAMRQMDARQGSKALKDAIFKSWGMEPTVIVSEPPKKSALKRARFKRRKIVRLPHRRIIKRPQTDATAIKITDQVAKAYRISPAQIRHPSRLFAWPRQVAMYAIRHRCALSFPNIGFHFSGRDHTTVMHAIRLVQEKVDAGDEETIRIINAVYEKFGA